jgi:hypothetical protein
MSESIENKPQEPNNPEKQNEPKKNAKPVNQSGGAKTTTPAKPSSSSSRTGNGNGDTSSGGDGTDDKLERTKWNMAIYLIASLAALIIIGVTTYFLHPNILIKTIVFTGVSGGIGGVLYAVRGFIYHNETNTFVKVSKWATLYQPITGFLSGVVVYFLIVGGLLTLSTGSSLASTANYQKGILFYCGIAFLAGFGTKKFNEKLDELATTIFSAGPDSSSAKASTGASKLDLAGLPNPATVGTEGSVTVTAKDSKGKTMTAYTGQVKLTSDDEKASLPANYTFQTSDNGVHIFEKVTLNTSGDHTITATDTEDDTITGTLKVTVK